MLHAADWADGHGHTRGVKADARQRIAGRDRGNRTSRRYEEPAPWEVGRGVFSALLA
jgi:hypothetical protein